MRTIIAFIVIAALCSFALANVLLVCGAYNSNIVFTISFVIWASLLIYAKGNHGASTFGLENESQFKTRSAIIRLYKVLIVVFIVLTVLRIAIAHFAQK